MRRFVLLSVLLLLASIRLPAADDFLDRLATCQTSWMDFKDDPVQKKKFAETFSAGFEPKGNDGSWTPKKPAMVIGLPVVRVYPESVGMGVGFSVVVDATFDQARAQIEKTVGKSLKNCENSEGMHTCELEVAEKRTILLLTGDTGKTRTTMLGCYYFYAK